MVLRLLYVIAKFVLYVIKGAMKGAHREIAVKKKMLHHDERGEECASAAEY